MHPAQAPPGAGPWLQGAQHQAHTPHPRPLATAGQPHTLLKGQHIIKPLRSPLALSKAAFSHDSEKEQKGWKLSDLLKTAMAQRYCETEQQRLQGTQPGWAECSSPDVPCAVSRSCPSPHIPPAPAGTLWAARGSWTLAALGLSPRWSSGVLLIPHRRGLLSSWQGWGGSRLQEERAGAAPLLGRAVGQGPLTAGTWPQGGTSHPLSPREAGWSLGCFHQLPGALKSTKQEVSTRHRALLLQHPSPATAAVQAAPHCTPAQSPPWPCCLPPPLSGCCREPPSSHLRHGSDAEGSIQNAARHRLSCLPGPAEEGGHWLWPHMPVRGASAQLPPRHSLSPPQAGRGEHSPPPAPAVGSSEQGPAGPATATSRASTSGHPAQAVGSQSPGHQPPLGYEGTGDETGCSLPSLMLTEGDKQGHTEEAALHTHLFSLTRESVSIRPGQQHLPTHLQEHGRSPVHVQVGWRLGMRRAQCRCGEPSPPLPAQLRFSGQQTQAHQLAHRTLPWVTNIPHSSPGSLLPLHSLSLPFCYGLPYTAVHLPLDQDQVHLLHPTLRASPYPARTGHWSRKATRGTTDQLVHKQTAEEEPKREEKCWRFPGSTDSRNGER